MAEQDGTIDGYQRGVLNVQAAVSVTLAQKRIPLDTVLSLGPGAMLTFEKNCDEPLTIEVGGHAIATGEVVKVGDKFGVRIRSFDPSDAAPDDC